MDNLDKKLDIFGKIFLLANKLQLIGDKRFAGVITTKQWFLTAVLSSIQEEGPTLSRVAKEMGSSRQNVKQLALKLQKKKLLELKDSSSDGRAKGLYLTQEFKEFWAHREADDYQFINELFSVLSEDEIFTMFLSVNKLLKKIEELSEETK